jgi:drug/metabolite transporter (DMT)-like permease
MLVFALYTVALRRVPAGLTPMPQFVIMAGAATLALLPFAAAEVATGGPPLLNGRTLPWIAAVVLLAGIAAFLGYSISIRRNGPVLTAASISLTPIYAAGLAIVLIGERIAWYHGIALALVVTGLLLVNHGQAVSSGRKGL